MRSSEAALRPRRSLSPILLSLALAVLMALGMLFTLENLFPMPDGLLSELAQRPGLQGASPARILLEGMASWYRSLLLLPAAALVIVAAAAVYFLRGSLRHRRWYRAHRAEYRAARAFLQLVEINPILVVEEPWNYNSKNGPDPTPGWWDEVWEKKARAEGLAEEYVLHSGAAFSGFLGLAPILAMYLLLCVMVFSEEVPDLWSKARTDMAQIEAGQCETAVVWLSPKAREWHIDGPYSSRQPTLLTRYGAISEDTGGKWLELYVPYGLDFKLDPDRLYDETRPILWNAENAQMYEVSYTSGFFLIHSITPAQTPERYF